MTLPGALELHVPELEPATEAFPPGEQLVPFRRRERELGRVLTVIKTRASNHRPEIHEYEITPDGIVLTDIARV